ncbi:unnamed protein product [Lepidochelys kempii]
MDGICLDVDLFGILSGAWAGFCLGSSLGWVPFGIQSGAWAGFCLGSSLGQVPSGIQSGAWAGFCLGSSLAWVLFGIQSGPGSIWDPVWSLGWVLSGIQIQPRPGSPQSNLKAATWLPVTQSCVRPTPQHPHTSGDPWPAPSVPGTLTNVAAGDGEVSAAGMAQGANIPEGAELPAPLGGYCQGSGWGAGKG